MVSILTLAVRQTLLRYARSTFRQVSLTRLKKNVYCSVNLMLKLQNLVFLNFRSNMRQKIWKIKLDLNRLLMRTDLNRLLALISFNSKHTQFWKCYDNLYRIVLADFPQNDYNGIKIFIYQVDSYGNLLLRLKEIQFSVSTAQ